MQKRVMFIAILLLAICNKIVAAGGTDLISISDFSLYSGGTKEVSVEMTNTDNYVGFQFDLVLPEGITVDSLSASERIPQGTSLQMAQQTDGSYRFIAYAQNRLPITGNDGAIMTLTLKASESVVPNSYTGYLRDVKMSTVDGGGVVIVDQLPFTITVKGDEPYTVLSDNNTVLTFYYDKKKDELGGTILGTIKSGTLMDRSWNDARETITTVSFDASMAGYTVLNSTAWWFTYLSKLTTINGLENLKTDNVTDMTAMFEGCSSLETIDLSSFNTANVTSLNALFSGCTSLQSVTLGTMNTEKVTDMRALFYNCPLLTTIDLSSFVTPLLTSIGGMFYGCTELRTIMVGNGWIITNIGGNQGDKDEVFADCTSLVGGMGTSYDANHVDYTYAHIDGGTANPGYFTDINTPSSYTVTLSVSDGGAVTVNHEFEDENGKMTFTVAPGDSLDFIIIPQDGFQLTSVLVDTLNVISDVRKIEGSESLIYTLQKIYQNHNVHVSFTELGHVAMPTLTWSGDSLIMHCATEEATIQYNDLDKPNPVIVDNEVVYTTVTYTAPIVVTNDINFRIWAIKDGMANSDTLLLNYPYTVWQELLSAIAVAEQAMTAGTGNDNVPGELLTDLNVELTNAKAFYVERIGGETVIRDYADRLRQKADAVMQRATAVDEPYGVLADNNDVLEQSDSTVTYGKTMTIYYDKKKIERGGLSLIFSDWRQREYNDSTDLITKVVITPSLVNATTITNTSYWFDGFKNLKEIEGLPNLNTTNVTNMECMFLGCVSLTSLDLSNFNTSRVTNMKNLFTNLWSLTTIDVSGLNTEAAVEMDGMFYGCRSLTSLDLSSFNTINAKDMSFMFFDCPNIKTIDLSSFNTSNVTWMISMFDNASALTTVYAGSGWTTESLSQTPSEMYGGSRGGDYMFRGCRSIKGGLGTAYDENYVDYTYAHIDGGASNPGYFTDKNAPVWSVIGTINGDWNTDTDMTSEDGVHYSASFPYLPAGEYAFKIRANHDWTVNYGDGGVQDGPNVFANVSEDLSTVVVTFNADTKEIAYSIVAPVYSIVGSFNSWDDSVTGTMTKDVNGIYSVTFNLESGEYEYKVRTNHEWTYNWGADGVQDGSNILLTVSEAGPVTIYFDPVTHIASTTYPQQMEQVATPTFSWNEDLLTISSETEGATITYKLEDGYYLVGGNGDWGNFKNQKMSQSSEEYIYTYVLQGFGTDLWFAFGDVAALNAIDNGNWNQLFGATNDGSELSGTYDRRYNLGGDHSFHVDGMAPYYRFTINTLDKTYLIEPLDSVPEFSASAENVYTYTDPVEIKRDVYITAVAKKEGMKDSEVANLDYPYTAWQDLRDAENKAQSVIYEYAGNDKVPQNMLDALKHLLDEADYMYAARTAERADIEDMAARLRSMSEEIKQMAAPGINIYVAASEAPYLYAYDADNVSLNGDYFPGNVMSKKVTVNGEEFWTTKINHTGPFNINLVDSGYYRTREIYVISDRYFIYKGKDEYTDVTMKYFNAPEITISSIALPGNHNNWNRTKTFTEVEPGKKYTMDVDLTNVAIDDSLFTFKLYANACAWLGITSVTLEAPSYVRIIGDPALSADARNFYLDLNEAPTRKFTFEATWSGGYQMEEGWTLKITEATPTEQVETPSFSWLNDELSISTKTEGANIYYQLSDTDVNGDEVINDADYALYSTALTIQRDVIIRAYAEKRGMLTSDTLVLEYPYRAWMDLKDMFNIARSMFSSAENTNKVPEDLLSEMLRQSYIAEDMFKERMAGRGDIEDQASILHHLINEVNSWLQVVASFENGLLTVQKATTLAEALNKCDANKVNESITTIVWASRQKLTDSDMQAISNPNVLIYVTDESMTSVTKNVVVGNDSIGFTAKNIVLTDVTNGNGDFKCTQAFTAERISYTREFKQQTQVDVCRGWETIALPFAVQTVTHERNGVIAPFGNSASGKHFWLRQLTQSGLQTATTIEANMPYLISMPNNTDLYAADFNQGGRVTFTAENAAVPVTTQHVTALADSTILFVPTTMQVGRSSDVWALNVGQVRGANLEGSVFERDFREVHPFEAYTVHRSNTPAPRFVPINDINGGNLTGIDASLVNSEKVNSEKWYDLNGRQLQQKPTKGGVYILNGKKVVLR